MSLNLFASRASPQHEATPVRRQAYHSGMTAEVVRPEFRFFPSVINMEQITVETVFQSQSALHG